MTKEKLKTILFIVLLVVYNLAALSGAVVASIYQYQLHIEKFGMFMGNAHIYNVHDWWLLTMLLFIPEALFFGVEITGVTIATAAVGVWVIIVFILLILGY